MLDKVGGVHILSQSAGTQSQDKAAKKNETQLEEYKQVKQPSKEEMEKVVNGINAFLRPANTHLKFEFHDELKEYYVSIVDDVTQEVVKEIPPRKLLDMYAAMTDFLGILVDKKI